MPLDDRPRAAARSLARALTRPRPIAATLGWASRRGLVPPFIWRRLPVWRDIEVELPAERTIFFRTSVEDALARQLAWRGLKSPEGATIRVFSELAAQSRTVVDVGANVGFYTLVACAASPSCEVIAFEPVERTRQRLEENLRLNGFSGRCLVRAEALADSTGTARFYFPDRDQEHPYPTGGSLHEVGGRFIDATVARGDDLLGDLRSELIKLDIEGGELEALRGLRRLIARSRPAIILEITPDKHKPGTESLLREFGYRFFEIGPAGPLACERLVPERSFTYLNYLCLHADDPRRPG